ncbi:hypothetical protein B0A55_00242 [Friedmanniomyces simplex]|uniref:C3H1-type domain-containing protein n=1 Tax=Friedmanniomyces simplex TaxID=329884 RepID=A0A4U0Y0L8_9PEZI|nr:hypothetical protein B0A55_00242 [Friedmanniomyces simplex]
MAGFTHPPAFQSFNPQRGMPAPYQPLPPSQPRPLYFISRDTGIMVPLVPADELPFNVRLAGVPRVMQMEDTLGMQHVGMAAYTGMTYTLERDIRTGAKFGEDPAAAAIEAMQRSTSQPPPPAALVPGHARSQSGTLVKYLAPDAHARYALAQSAAYNTAAYTSNACIPTRPVSAHETATTWRSTFNPTPTPADTTTKTFPPTTTHSTSAKTPDSTQSIIDAILSTTSGAQEASRLGYISKTYLPPPPSGMQPNAEKKEYCTFWIRTGECDYTQQGCLYKHEMPDRGTLERIGFRGVPRWWVERQQREGTGGGIGSGVRGTGGFGVGGGAGERPATVGEVVKSSVWLKKNFGKEGGGGGEESESESEGSVVGSESGKGGEESGEVKETAAELKKSKEIEPDNGVAQTNRTITRLDRPIPTTTTHKDAATKVSKPRALGLLKAPAPATNNPATRATLPPAMDIRKASTTSDLIDFAVPLLPTPSSSSTPSLTPASSVDSSPRQGQITPLTPPTPQYIGTENGAVAATKTVGKVSTKHVFVPKGEAAAQHIAEALQRKRLARQYARRGAPVSTVGATLPLERQIREMQKAQIGRKCDEGKLAREGGEKEERVGLGLGLMASRHAPPSGKVAEGDGKVGYVRADRSGERKGPAKMGGMRVRRPPGSAAVKPVGGMQGSVKISRKEAGSVGDEK